MLTVLVTSASRKVSLVQAFREALDAEGGGTVVACDASPHAAALYQADAGVVVPRLDDPAFAPRLEALCAEHGVGLLIPTRDEELPWFAERREELAERGVRVPVPDPEVVALCADKVAFARFCREEGFGVPETFPAPLPSLADLPYPLFVRPRRGKGSRGAGAVRDAGEMERRLEAVGGRQEELLVQRRVDAPELTVDLAADFGGRVLSVVPRLRLQTFGGESFVGRTVDDRPVAEAAAALARRLGLVGHNTVQCFHDGDSVRFIEVNPRFGGGAALGFAAGAHTPRMLVRLALGREVEPRLGRFRAGLTMLRYTDDLFLEPGDLLPDLLPEVR